MDGTYFTNPAKPGATASCMTTAQRAEALAQASVACPFLGEIAGADLLELVRLELGHAEILDGPRRYGSISARAFPPQSLLHIVSGATPHAALQSVLRGLLLGGPNRCKLPERGLPEVAEFRKRLPKAMQALLECRPDLPPAWLEEADVVVAFGRDETLAEIRARLRPDQRFIGHGQRISFGLVTHDPAYASVPGAARDASLFDQRGCLSPQVFFVQENEGTTAREYARRLAEAMADFQLADARGPLDLSGHAAIREARLEIAFRAAQGEPLELWSSEGGTDWTVVCDATGSLAATPPDRFVVVKPLTASLDRIIAPVRPWVSAIGVWPLDEASAELATGLGASRVCRIGRMQNPSPFWHQDGQPQLAPLVRWVDWEMFADRQPGAEDANF